MLVKFEENAVGFDEVPGGYFSLPKPLHVFVITWVGYKLCKMDINCVKCTKHIGLVLFLSKHCWF